MTERKWVDTPWVACGGYTEFDTVEGASGEAVAYDVASGYVAHLIAAAPDLYEALDIFLKKVTDIRGFDVEFYAGYEIKIAMNALSKALGETQ